MKFKELLEDIVYEQHIIDPNGDQDPEDPEDGIHGFDDQEFAGNAEPDDDDPNGDREDLPNIGLNIGRNPKSYEDQKKFTRTQLIKLKWRDENPAITDQQASDAVAFFNERKDRLKPYHPYGYIDPATNRHYINLPEIAALVERFPDMTHNLSDPVKIKDLSNYTWEQISFYMNRIYRQAIEVDDENWVPGDFTEDQRIQMALQRWTKPYNQLIHDDTLTIYKVECKAEAVALGALDHAIFRKYHDEKIRKTLPLDVRRELIDMSWASQPWCIARPIGGQWGGNLWTSYRPGNAFYFVLDNSKPEWHKYHIAALQTLQGGTYNLSTMTNNTEYPDWETIETIYPGLRGKKNMFPWFGTTPREKMELTLDVITFRKGDQHDFAVLPNAVHTTYIENGRYVRNVRCFLTLSFSNRKLYIDKASKENDDYKQRFICDDDNDPFGILEILRIQKKPDDLYKYLDGFTLKQRLGILDGILAIKKTIIGTNWRRWLSDIDSDQTLVSGRNARMRTGDKPKYGILNINNADIIKDIQYIAEAPKSYMHRTAKDDNGKPKIYIFQRYIYSLGNGQIDPNEYFYFLCLKDAFTNRQSEHYLQGKYYDGKEGDAFIQDQISRKELIKI
jgi:hypothetical protein